MSRVKMISAIVVALLIIIVVLQNTQAVETKLLIITVTMPRAVLLFVTLLVGFVAGLAAASLMTRRATKNDADAGPA